jgi:Cytosine deaminase and related metal-dependent hydrolases
MDLDLLIVNGVVVTMNDDFEVIEEGAVGIQDGRIAVVGQTSKLQANHDPEHSIDAADQIVLPGLIDTHVHVSDILSRGLGKQRRLHDWIINSKRPFVAAMDAADHEIASQLYSYEAIRSGITTFVENAGATGKGYNREIIAGKMGVYDEAGIRNIYAHGFVTENPNEEMASLFATLEEKEPEVNHPPSATVTPEKGLREVESLIEQYHGSAGGRQSVWPAPYLARSVSGEALRGAYELAETYDVMTTTHAAESEHQERYPNSTIEYLDSVDYLGERCLLGHCVQTDSRDLQLLADTDTKVAHNMAANLALASGIAPVPNMIETGITVGLGTDNACLSDIVNLFADMRMVSLAHKGHTKNPGALRARQTLQMATRDGAETIGRGNDLGSLEEGKKADLILLDLDHPHLIPTTNVYSTIVHQVQGHEVETVICDGNVIMKDSDVQSIDRSFSDLRASSVAITDEIIKRAGIDGLRTDMSEIDI